MIIYHKSWLRREKRLAYSKVNNAPALLFSFNFGTTFPKEEVTRFFLLPIIYLSNRALNSARDFNSSSPIERNAQRGDSLFYRLPSKQTWPRVLLNLRWRSRYSRNEGLLVNGGLTCSSRSLPRKSSGSSNSIRIEPWRETYSQSAIRTTLSLDFRSVSAARSCKVRKTKIFLIYFIYQQYTRIEFIDRACQSSLITVIRIRGCAFDRFRWLHRKLDL